MKPRVFKINTTQLDRVKASINLLGLNEFIHEDDISIDPEKRSYKIPLVLPPESMLNMSDNRMGLILTIPMASELLSNNIH